jgi:hypothetical protein
MHGGKKFAGFLVFALIFIGAAQWRTGVDELENFGEPT